MPHQNGRIFTHTESGVKHGVSVGDIQQTLGRGTGDVGLLCSDLEWYDNNGTQALRPVEPAKINKWAKYRPIEKANYKGILTDAMRSSENWGIGNIPKWTNKTIPAMTKFWIGGTGSTGSTPPDCGIQDEYWTRVLPSTSYRILDFAADVDDKGYWQGANAPISPFVGDLAIPSTGQLDISYIRGVENNETILLSDIGSFGNYFFGVIFANADFSLIYLVTQQYAMGSASWTQDFAVHIQGAASVLVPSGTSANWRVFPILINVQSAVTTLTDMHSSLAEYTIVALLDYVDATITKNGVDYTFLAEYASRDNNSRIVSFSFYFKNDDGTTGLTGVRVAVEYKTQLGEVIATGTAMVQCTGQNPGTVPADTYGSATGAHTFDNASIAASIYSVVGHVDNIDGRDYTIVWREARVNAITPD